jgi:hypothetical protein
MEANLPFSEAQLHAFRGFGFSTSFAAFLGHVGFFAFAKTSALILASRLALDAAESTLAPAEYLQFLNTLSMIMQQTPAPRDDVHAEPAPIKRRPGSDVWQFGLRMESLAAPDPQVSWKYTQSALPSLRANTNKNLPASFPVVLSVRLLTIDQIIRGDRA